MGKLCHQNCQTHGDEGRPSALNMHNCNSTPMRLPPLFVLRDSFPAAVKRDTNISGAEKNKNMPGPVAYTWAVVSVTS